MRESSSEQTTFPFSEQAPSKLPPPLPKPTLPLRPELSDPKRKRGLKGKEVMKVEKSRPTPEEEVQRAAKQQKVGHRDLRKGSILCLSPRPGSRLQCSVGHP